LLKERPDIGAAVPASPTGGPRGIGKPLQLSARREIHANGVEIVGEARPARWKLKASPQERDNLRPAADAACGTVAPKASS